MNQSDYIGFGVIAAIVAAGVGVTMMSNKKANGNGNGDGDGNGNGNGNGNGGDSVFYSGPSFEETEDGYIFYDQFGRPTVYTDPNLEPITTEAPENVELQPSGNMPVSRKRVRGLDV